MINATWVFWVDWVGDGNYAGDHDNITNYVREADWQRGYSSTSPLDCISPAGTCNIVLDNRTGMFSSFNAASDIAGLILPRRRIKITSTHGINGWTYSEQADNAVWTKTRCTVSANTCISPDRLTTADSILESVDNNTHNINREPPAMTSNTLQTVSFYAGSGLGRTYCAIRTHDKSLAAEKLSIINVVTGAIAVNAAGHTIVVTYDSVGGFWRIAVTFDSSNTDGGAGTPLVRIGPSGAATDSYAGDITKGIYVWGMQFQVDTTTPGGYDKTEATAHPVTQTQWAGYLDSIQATPALNRNHEALLRGYGPLGLTTEAKAHYAIQTNWTTDAAFDGALDGISYPAGDRTHDTGQTTMARWWASSYENGYQTLQRIAATEGGKIHESKDSKIVFESRAHRAAAPHDTLQVSYRSTLNGLYVYAGIEQQDPSAGIFNIVRANVNVMDNSASHILWELTGTALSIAASPGTALVIATSSGAAVWSTFTFVANSAANGSGDPETANVDYVANSYADRSYITFTNNAAHVVYITSASWTGYTVGGGGNNEIAEKTDPGSVGVYGERPHEYNSGFISSMSEANNYCTHFLALCHDPHPSIVLKLLSNTSVTMLNDALTRDISDYVNIYATAAGTSLGIDGAFYIEHIWHQLTRDKDHFTWLTCSAAVADTWAAEATAYTSGTSNRVLVSPGGVSLGGDARVEKHINIPLDGMPQGSTAPTITRVGSVYGWAFTINDNGYGSIEIPSDWDTTTIITITAHVYTDEAYALNNGEIRFQAEWAIVPEGGTEAVDSPTHFGTLTGEDLDIDATAKQMQEYSFGYIAAASIAVDNQLFLKITRIALKDGTGPTAEPVLVSLEIEYTADKLGYAM